MKILAIRRNDKGQFLQTWAKHRIKTVCQNKDCGKEFETVESRIKDGKGKYCSKECYNKIAKGKRHSVKTEFKKGQISFKAGKHFPEMSGKNHWNWKDGRSKLSDRIRKLPISKEWRKLVFERDNYTCQSKNCGKKGCYLEAHHKKKFSIILDEYNIKTIKDALNCKKLWDINNGITLCKKCHNKTKVGKMKK